MQRWLRDRSGLTLIELLLGGMTLAITAAAILGAYLGQVTLNEHARNLALAVHDANRVIEQVRQINSPCTSNPLIPTVIPVDAAGNPQPTWTWNTWMTTGNPGAPKSFQPDPDTNERIVVTCQASDGSSYCPSTQMGSEWHAPDAVATAEDPIRVTVAVCWRHRQRTIGECRWDGAALIPDDTLNVAGDTASVIDSPAMLTTLVTCRQ